MNREEKIKQLRSYGWTWSAIGNYFDISRSRAHQIGSGYREDIMAEIRKKILKRDNYTCQWGEKCKDKTILKDDLIVHHIDFNDRNNNLDNLITLCRPCHTYFHQTKAFHSEVPNYKKIKPFIREQQNKKWRRKCAGCGKMFVIPKTTRWNYYRDHSKFKRKSYCSRECFFNSIS